MSEKHLTELPWKTLVTKQGVKDIGLGKVLSVYTKLDRTREPARALETLKEISELGIKLKKLNTAKEEVVAYLDEVIKEVKKSTPPLEARTKSAPVPEVASPKAPVTGKPGEEDEGGEDEDEEREAAEFKKDLKQKMVSALAQVKMRAPGEPGAKEPKPQFKFMAYLAGKSCAVLVALKVGSASKKLLPDIAGGVTGGKFILGECIFEKNAHTFVLESVPGGLAKKLTTALNAETGQKYRVRVRSLDGSTVLDSDTDVDPDAPQVQETKPQPDENEPKRRELALRLEELRKKPFPPSLESLKKQSLEKATSLGAVNKFAEANQLLDQLAARAVTPPASPPATPPKSGPKLSTYMNASKDWKVAKAAAANGVFALKNAIFKECDPELKDPVKAKIDSLNSILTVMDDGIMTKIEDAGREADPERQVERNQELAKFAGTLLDALRKHPLAAVADSNPFGTFTICSPVETVLTRITKDFAN
jgi:hypothetical protein